MSLFFFSCRWPRSDIRSSLAKAFTGEHSQNCFSSRNWLCNQFNFAFSLHPRHDTPEQFAFDPFSITLFLYSMSLFEGKSSEAARQEVSGFYHPDPAINSHQSKCLFSTFLQVSSKFVSVYTIGFVYWPITQTINFAWVKPRNQVIYVSFASLIWTTFLAYMKVKWNFSFVTLPNWYLYFAKPSFPTGPSHRERFRSWYIFALSVHSRGSAQRQQRHRRLNSNLEHCTYFVNIFIDNVGEHLKINI